MSLVAKLISLEALKTEASFWSKMIDRVIHCIRFAHRLLKIAQMMI
jgi:uncharacterized protein Usg